VAQTEESFLRFMVIELSPSGGLFQFSYQLGSQLAAHGHQVELVTGPEPELESHQQRFRISSILPTWHPGATTVEPLLLRRVRRVVRGIKHAVALILVLRHIARQRPDVVLWHQLRFAMDSWCVVAADRLSPARMAIIMHETRVLSEQRRSGSFYRSNPVVERSLGAAVRRMDHIFVLGQPAREHVESMWDPAVTVEVIPHGDEEVFLTGEPVPEVATTEPHILFFGIWTRHKGIDVLFDAFEEVRRRVPQARLTLAGAIGDVVFDSIRRRADEVGAVELRPGYVPLAEVADLMGSSRVVVVPYLRANQSGVVHLAQTFGRPVVATDVGNISETVQDRIGGLVVQPGDRQSLADALVELLLDPDLAAKMGAQGRRRVETEGAWSEIADRVARSVEHSSK